MDPAPTQVTELQTQVDDVSGERLGSALETLLAEGALDAWLVPIQMKKGRPGSICCVLVRPEDGDRFARRLLELTGSFGVRYRTWDRLVLDREHRAVDTPVGRIRIKIGRLDGRVVSAKPEYEDVRRAAEASGGDWARVWRLAQVAADQVMGEEEA